jgi:pyruvate/2-oxoglutarate dehydrogenase complex dihydrolipoamide dehydrogenase (E3) component
VRICTHVAGLSAVERLPDGSKRLSIEVAGQPQTIVAEAVILAIGWPADLDGLGLEQAGVEVERGFIAINPYLQTTAAHIFAAGDANGRDMLVQGAHFQAEVAAENAVLGPTRVFERHSLPSGGFTDPDHAGVGYTEAQAQAAGLDYLVGLAHYNDLERAIIDGRTTGFLKLIAEREGGRIVGAHGTGENAVEVMQAVATAMATQATAATLAAVRFAYPTYTAVIGVAARQIVQQLG